MKLCKHVKDIDMNNPKKMVLNFEGFLMNLIFICDDMLS
jgi:hypothetical protein